MSDLDFDELDRAVSSALVNDQSDPVPADNSDDELMAENIVEITPSEPMPSTVPVTRVTPTAPVVPRPTSGRFMDVVHPSSDMRSASPSPVRQRPFHADEVHSKGPETFAPVVEPEAPAVTSDWPDPLDFQGYNDTDAVAAVPPVSDEVVEPFVPPVFTPTEPVVPVTPIESVIPDVPEVPAEPLSSPFLTDAKIEKRPLGAFSDPVAAPEVVDVAPVVEESSVSLPAELADDLLSIEASDVTTKTVAAAPAPVFVGAAARTEVTPTVPSITQQYKERPSTAEQSSGAIFDTENYHKPLAHTPKAKGSLFIILWILGLIVVGGGLGAVMYFFVLK